MVSLRSVLLSLSMAFFASIWEGNSQVGNEFWFVAPDVTVSHGDNPIALRITAMDKPVKVTISMPANGAFTPIVVNVPAYRQVSVKSDDGAYSAMFNKANVENQPKNTVNNKGILVTSEGGDISVYYEVLMSNNPDIFTMKGLNALGKEFYVPSQNAFPNHSYQSSGQTQPFEQINIVATENGTTVTITPSAAIQGGAAGTPITVVLNKGQTYSVLANDWKTAGFSLAGTLIESDKDIAVTISDDSIDQWANAGSWDLIGDQIVPTSIIGTEYIAIKTSNVDKAVNKVFVMAIDDNTSVTIDNNTPVSLNKGEIKEIDIPSTANAIYIKSSSPVYVYQVSGLWNNNGNEMGSALLPTIACTGSSRVSFTRNFAKSFWVQIMVQGKNLGNFKMYDQNGVEVAAFTTALNTMSWSKVAASDKGNPSDAWYTATVDMTIAPFKIGTQSYSIENSKGLFHLSVLDENNGSLSYGYYSSYSTVKIDPPTKTCVGTVVRLESKYPTGSFYWKSKLTGSAIISTDAFLDVTESGRYFLYMDSNWGCEAKDSIDVVMSAPIYDLGDPISACPGEAYTISVPNGYTSYLWSTGETTSSISVTPKPNETINISVSVYDKQGCSKTDDVTVVSAQPAALDLTHVASQVCVGDVIRNNTTMVDYRWEVNGVHIPEYDGKDFIVASTSGTYKLTGTSLSGCEATETLNITVNPLPTFSLADQVSCANTPITFTGPVGGNIVKYQWTQDGVPVDPAKVYNGSTFQVLQTGTVTLEVTDSNGCKASDTASPSWHTASSVDIGYNSPVAGGVIYPSVINTCPENTVALTATSGFVSYVWTENGVIRAGATGATLSNVAVTSGGEKIVRVNATDANGCVVTDQVSVKGYPTPVISTNKAEYCVGEVVSVTPSMERYEWSLAGVVLGTSSTFVPTQSGIYEVTGWDVNNCSSAKTQFVVNPLPVVGITGNPVCDNTPFVFSGSSSITGSYLWSQENVPVDPAKIYTAPTFSTLNQGTVWLEVTTAKGCKAKTSSVPTWFDNPTVDITYYLSVIGQTISSDEAYICPLSKVELKGDATSPTATTFTFYWTVDGVYAGNNSTLEVEAPSSGQRVVDLLVTDANGCTATDKITVIALESPINLINTLDGDICLGEALSVESIRNDITAHKWEYLSDGTSNSLYTFTPTQSGTYRLTVWNRNDCSDYRDFTVHDPAVVIAAPGNVVKECANTSHQFDVVPQAGFAYTWSTDAQQTNVVGTGNSYVANTPGTYWVSSSSTLTAACQSKAQVTLDWHPSKLLDVGNKLTVCSTGFPIDLAANPTMSNYQWYFNGALVDNDNTYTITQAGTYTVTADYLVGGANCSIVQTFEVESLAVLPALQINNSAFCSPGVICICENEQIVLTATNGFASYQWYEVVGGVDNLLPGKTQSSLNVTQDGDYKLIALQSNGCNSEGIVTVNITELPEVNIVLSDNSACTGSNVTLTNVVADARPYNYNWSLNGTTIGTSNPLSVIANKTETYTLSVNVTDITYGKTCSSQATATVAVPVKPTVALSDVTICSNECLDLSTKFSPASVAGLVSYDWYLGGTLLGKNDCVNQAGVYVLRVRVNDLGVICEYDYTFNLVVLAAPSFTSLTDPAAICDGKTALLDAGGNYFAYKWTYFVTAAGPASTTTYPNTRTISVGTEGYYQVQAWTNYGTKTCTETSPKLYLDVNPNPTLALTKSMAYLCEGGSVNLNALNSNVEGQPTVYQWEGSGVSNTVGDYTVSSAGVYTVKATDANGCQSESSITLENYTVTPVARPALPAVCQGQTVQLPAIPAVYQYQWFAGNVGNATQGVVNSPWDVAVGGTYVLSYLTESYGCPVEIPVNVTVNPLPVIGLAPSYAAVCDGTVVTLDAGGSYPVYQWIRKGVAGNPDVVVGNDMVYEAKVTGTYQVQAWTEKGCTNQGTVDVTVNPNPIVNLGNDFSVCPGIEFDLTVQNASNLSGFVWSTGASNNGLSSIKSTLPGVYMVTAYDANGCFSRDTISVANYVPVNYSLPVVAPICDNTTYNLVSPLAAPQIQSYQWFYNNVGNPVQQVINTNWAVANAGTYVLEVVDLNGCRVSKSLTLSVIPAPDFDLGPDRQGCVGDSLIINVKNTYIRYMWNNDPLDNRHFKVVDPSISSYTLEVEDRNGCITTKSVNYVANPLPVFSLGSDITKCAGLETPLAVSGNYPSVLWSSGEITASITAYEGNYWAKVTDANGCSATDDILITWLPNPKPVLGADTLICPLHQLELDAGSGFTLYKWHNGAGSQRIYANIVDTVNTVVVTDVNGCSGWDSKLVFHMDTPEYVISPDTTLCANYVLELDAGEEYPFVTWSTGETTRVIEVNQPGEYRLVATDGCVVVRDTVNVTFLETPVVAALDTMIYAQVTVLAQGGTQPYLYSLNNGRLQESNVFKKLKNGTHEIYIEDANQCYATEIMILNSTYDIDIPQYFTPNSDGYHDVWQPEGLQRFPDAEIFIYDRYGKLLAKLSGASPDWDGLYMGKPLPSDDYWYVINLVNINKTLKGHITLKR